MVGSPGLGCIPFWHSARILPGVSFPSSVVRSIIRIARSSAHTLDAFLIDRFCSDATRSCTPTWSTGVTRPSSVPRLPARLSNARINSWARSRVALSRATEVVIAASLPPPPHAERAPAYAGARSVGARSMSGSGLVGDLAGDRHVEAHLLLVLLHADAEDDVHDLDDDERGHDRVRDHRGHGDELDDHLARVAVDRALAERVDRCGGE